MEPHWKEVDGDDGTVADRLSDLPGCLLMTIVSFGAGCYKRRGSGGERLSGGKRVEAA